VALDDYVESEVAIAVAATAAILSPKVRGLLRQGAVYGLAGVLTAGDAIGSFARSVSHGARQASAGATGPDAARGTAEGQPTQDEETAIEVDVPVRVAYDQWTQFETFPQFMEGIEEVTQRDDTHLHWRATVGGKQEEWDAEITEQRPDELISWRGTSGAPNGGTVTFDKRGEGQTHVTLHLVYTPQGPVEQAGAALGVLSRQIEGDLRRFKEFIEARGHTTGAWRGEVQGGSVQDADADAALGKPDSGVRPRRSRRTQEEQTDA